MVKQQNRIVDVQDEETIRQPYTAEQRYLLMSQDIGYKISEIGCINLRET